MKRKAEPSGASTARVRKLRDRKLSTRRAYGETIFRKLLERFYTKSGFESADWVLGSEFFGSNRDLATPSEFHTAMALDAGIDTAILRLEGNPILLIRPRYFFDIND